MKLERKRGRKQNDPLLFHRDTRQASVSTAGLAKEGTETSQTRLTSRRSTHTLEFASLERTIALNEVHDTICES